MGWSGCGNGPEERGVTFIMADRSEAGFELVPPDGVSPVAGSSREAELRSRG